MLYQRYLTEFQTKRGSPFNECKSRYSKIRSLSMCSISCCTRPYVFTSFARMKKSTTSFQANDDVKVDKTQALC